MVDFKARSEVNNLVIKHKNISIISIILLLIATLNLPYGYYTFLRIAITISAIYLANIAYKTKKDNWVILMGIVAVLFNPIFPIHLDKELWVIIDIIVAGLFLLSIFMIKLKGR